MRARPRTTCLVVMQCLSKVPGATEERKHASMPDRKQLDHLAFTSAKAVYDSQQAIYEACSYSEVLGVDDRLVLMVRPCTSDSRFSFGNSGPRTTVRGVGALHRPVGPVVQACCRSYTACCLLVYSLLSARTQPVYDPQQAVYEQAVYEGCVRL